MQRYSKKRQSILECLRGTREHPCAEWVYSQIKPQYPDLSLGTVYRNLRQLEKDGLIRTVGIVNGQERFDACTAPHAHAVCVVCGRMTDLPGVPVPSLPEDPVAAGFTVRGVDVQYSGICEACRAKEKQNDTNHGSVDQISKEIGS